MRIYFYLDIRVLSPKKCCICGIKLKRKLFFAPEKYETSPFGLPIKKHRSYTIFALMCTYYCKKCGYLIEYINQKEISKLQKETGKNLLDNGQKLIKKYKYRKKDE